MELRINDYIRTKDGIIDKVIIKYNGRCANPTCNRKHVSCERDYYDEDEIIKTSPQIIDLIWCGDYVNGYKVIGIVKGFKILVDKLELDTTTGLYHHKSIMAKNIKTIVTHEQMLAMQYRVEE